MRFKLLFLIGCLSLQLQAQKIVSYVKIERTACFGRCPVYSIEVFANGKVVYNGVRNVNQIGQQTKKLSKQQTTQFFKKIEQHKLSVLANQYTEKASDLPRLHETFIIRKKTKRIQNAQAGPSYLTAIAVEVDLLWNSLTEDAKSLPVVEPSTEPFQLVENDPTPPTDVFLLVDQMPEFPGGTVAMNKYIMDKLMYPITAKDDGVQGKVIVGFVIAENGEVKDVTIARGVRADLDNEAVRVIRLMPNWRPGKQNGKPVNVRMNIPINFKLN